MHTYVYLHVLERMTEQRQVRYGSNSTFPPGRHDSVRSKSHPLWHKSKIPGTSMIARDHGLAGVLAGKAN
jgi:hypothetical protein